MDTPPPFTTPQWHDILKKGSTAKILKALKAGQPLCPPLPVNISHKQEPISPLSFAYGWDWDRKEKLCMAALDALIEAGADPNMPDHMGRRPLMLAIWLGAPISVSHKAIPNCAIEKLLAAGADPALRSLSTPNATPMDAYSACIIKTDMQNRGLDIVRLLVEKCPNSAARCEKNPLMVLAWNNSTMSDELCKQATYLLLDGGADPDEDKGGPIPRTPRQMPGRVRDFIEQWEAQQRAFAMASEMNQATPVVGEIKPGPRL